MLQLKFVCADSTPPPLVFNHSAYIQSITLISITVSIIVACCQHADFRPSLGPGLCVPSAYSSCAAVRLANSPRAFMHTQAKCRRDLGSYLGTEPRAPTSVEQARLSAPGMIICNIRYLDGHWSAAHSERRQKGQKTPRCNTRHPTSKFGFDRFRAHFLSSPCVHAH